MPGESSADCPGEGDDMDGTGARPAELGRGRGDRCPGRVDVVDEGYVPRRGRCDDEGSAYVTPPLLAREAALGAAGLRSPEQPGNRKLPAGRELACKRLGRVLAALQAPLGI